MVVWEGMVVWALPWADVLIHRYLPGCPTNADRWSAPHDRRVDRRGATSECLLWGDGWGGGGSISVWVSVITVEESIHTNRSTDKQANIQTN